MRLRNLDQKFKGLLKQGLAPKELAFSISVAILIGIFPIYGSTTVLLAFLALRLKLNLPIMIAISYILTPVQIFLIIPFARVGEFLFGYESIGMDLESLQRAFSEGIVTALSQYSGRLVLAVGGWAIVSIPLSVVIYIILFQIFRAMRQIRKRDEVNMSSD
ncbi:DUF2062 domain-containing protein [Aquiflexum sp. TKW24L]|uniref:DUF2062 domain-containing protein n=1 Tax=Aquiflexum sp. TKW24L TaxID=2942212 RepID=UPI0020BD93E4|nr:DUF2062 domain-containing protein [Aquiflexum sp. TKW24L]MCL6258246.1 DUF2062 domain-containing protein [Aquiflexum sp. TKW24L]